MAEFGESSKTGLCLEWNSGPKISVDVENVFEDGIVVSYTDADGREYRGAMLSQPDQKMENMVKTACEGLANPLTFLHDHPYPNLEKYAKHLSSKIPPEMLLQWNSLPSLNVSPLSDNLHAIATRKEKNYSTMFENTCLHDNRGGPQLSMPKINSATVLASPEIEPRYLFPVSAVNAGGRKAKRVANTKLLYGDLYNETTEVSPNFNKKNKKALSRARRSESSSLSPQPPPKKKAKSNHRHTKKIRKPAKKIAKKSTPPSKASSPTDSNDSVFVVEDHCPIERPRIALKVFSIPLIRIPISTQESYESSSTYTPCSSPIVIN